MLLSALREYDMRDYDHEVRAQHPNPLGTPKRHRLKNRRFKKSFVHDTGTETKGKNKMAKEKAAKAVEKKAEKAEKPKMLGTKEVAAKLGVDAKFLRVVLRDSGKKAGDGEEGGRYQWKPGSDLSAVKKLVEAYKEKAEKRAEAAAEKKEAEKKAASKKTKKDDKKAPAKKAAKKTKKAAEEVEEEEEGGEVFEEEAEEEEGE